MNRALILASAGLLTLASLNCLNPFAPGLDETASAGICPELSTVEGVFCTFQNSYTFRDTTLYGSLIAGDFAFIYRDYDNGVDVTWGRDQDLRSTYGLFQNVQALILTWNNIISEFGSRDTSHSISIVRSFNLTVTFNPSNIERVDGYANLQLYRDEIGMPWKIIRWRDESNF